MIPFAVLATLLTVREVLAYFERRAWTAERTRLVASAIARTPEAAVSAVQGAKRRVRPDDGTKPVLPIGL